MFFRKAKYFMGSASLWKLLKWETKRKRNKEKERQKDIETKRQKHREAQKGFPAQNNSKEASSEVYQFIFFLEKHSNVVSKTTGSNYKLLKSKKFTQSILYSTDWMGRSLSKCSSSASSFYYSSDSEVSSEGWSTEEEESTDVGTESYSTDGSSSDAKTTSSSRSSSHTRTRRHSKCPQVGCC